MENNNLKEKLFSLLVITGSSSKSLDCVCFYLTIYLYLSTLSWYYLIIPAFQENWFKLEVFYLLLFIIILNHYETTSSYSIFYLTMATLLKIKLFSHLLHSSSLTSYTNKLLLYPKICLIFMTKYHFFIYLGF